MVAMAALPDFVGVGKSPHRPMPILIPMIWAPVNERRRALSDAWEGKAQKGRRSPRANNARRNGSAIPAATPTDQPEKMSKTIALGAA